MHCNDFSGGQCVIWDTMHPGGPLRIVAWSTWSGRERSSHSHFPQVPQTRLASYLSSVSSSVVPADMPSRFTSSDVVPAVSSLRDAMKKG